MSHVGRTRCLRSAARLLAASALLSATLLACGGAAPVEVAVSGLPPAPPPASEPATRFQGSVVSVDAGAGVLVVNVSIVWTPVITGGGDERRVLVGASTRWDHGVTLAGLRAGDEVQVDAGDPVDGSWPALRVQLFDVE